MEIETHIEKSHQVSMFLDGLNSTYEKLLVLKYNNKYDVKNAFRVMGGYLNTTERKQIDKIVLTAILRELQ